VDFGTENVNPETLLVAVTMAAPPRVSDNVKVEVPLVAVM
jgi:hypothetical protein